MQSLEFENFTNPYIPMMAEFGPYIVDETLAGKNHGQWRQGPTRDYEHLDVEIGTGNGFHLSHRARTFPDRTIVGFEIKFKTVVQSIRRCTRLNCENARMIKADARNLKNFFANDEIDQLFIHFPDPWPKPRQQKNRLLNSQFLETTYDVIKPGGLIEFKTDHFGYFQSAARAASNSKFDMIFYSEDLHQSLHKDQNYVTQFESLFLRQRLPIYLFLLRKPLHS